MKFTSKTIPALTSGIVLAAIFLLVQCKLTLAASVPTLELINTASSVNISVSGADQNATVTFYYPNSYTNSTNSVTYTSIDIGQTNSAGSFTVGVAPNSYGLTGGVSVYVSVDGANSSKVSWPASVSSSGQTGSLTLSDQNISLVVGQSKNIFPMNTGNALSVQGNSNLSVVSTAVQTSNNSVLVTGLNAGSSTISICASTAGCATLSVSITAPTQAISFSLPQAYVVVGQPAQTISIYGPGTYSTPANTNKDAITASIDGTNLVLKGTTIGQATVSVCAQGYLCGSITVNSLASGSAIPNQTVLQTPVVSGFNEPPQLSTLTISSNNSGGLFFGGNSTISLNFGANVSVNNVQVKIGGSQTAVTQGSNGLYYTSYKPSASDVLPLAVAISFTDLSGRVGHSYLWIGDSTQNAPVSTVSGAQSAIAVSPGQSFAGSFTKYLYPGMTDYGVSDREVLALQQRLKADGFFSSSPTGYFGLQTKSAVEAFQKKNGLTVIGVVGPATRALLNKGI